MTQHTQGEWLIAPEDGTFVYALGPSGTNSFWAQCQSAGADRVSREELCANARLMKSAPQLLEALQAIVALDDGDSPDLWHFEDEFNAGRAAIAAATGTPT